DGCGARRAGGGRTIMKPTRRDFLKQSTAAMLTASAAGALGAIAAPQYVYGAQNLPQRDSRPTLVVVYLRGGADPLSTIVPFTDPTYYEVRPTIYVPPVDRGDVKGVLRLTD